VIIQIKINGFPARALVDSGSLGDFIFSSLADQLHLKHVELERPIALHLTVQGSQSKINNSMATQLEYDIINCPQYFDIVNLSNYDVILGMPFLFQHRVILTINEPSIEVGSAEPVDIIGDNVSKLYS
jgi:hypothetical protein